MVLILKMQPANICCGLYSWALLMKLLVGKWQKKQICNTWILVLFMVWAVTQQAIVTRTTVDIAPVTIGIFRLDRKNTCCILFIGYRCIRQKGTWHEYTFHLIATTFGLLKYHAMLYWYLTKYICNSRARLSCNWIKFYLFLYRVSTRNAEPWSFRWC